jgi:hypothetical protein
MCHLLRNLGYQQFAGKKMGLPFTPIGKRQVYRSFDFAQDSSFNCDLRSWILNK